MTDFAAIRIRVRERHLATISAVLAKRYGVTEPNIERLRRKWQETYDSLYASGANPEGYIEELRAEGMDDSEIVKMLVRQGKTGLRRQNG